MNESTLKTVVELARDARSQMPPETAFNADDQAAITRHSDLLVSFAPAIVDGFYNTVFGHTPTAAVFNEGERPKREDSLREWWITTVTKPCDDDYFAWMAMVGLVHVIREVSNPMMLSMANHISAVVEKGISDSSLESTEAESLRIAITHLMATVGAVITYGYDQAVETALFDVAGMPQQLLHRLRNQSVASSLRNARESLGK